MSRDPELTIRLARAADLPALTRLAGELGYPAAEAAVAARFERLEHTPGNAVFVACRREKVLGWIHVFVSLRLESDPFVEIGGLVVTEDARGQGLGARLVAAGEEWARGQGVARLRVRSRDGRLRTHQFYQGIGFERLKAQIVFSRGVAPAGEPRQVVKRPPAPPKAAPIQPLARTLEPPPVSAAEQAERDLFLRAMARLGPVPNKDAAAPKPRPQKKLDPRQLENPEASLDLHGKTVEEARRELASFIPRMAAEGLRTLLVVTGKGHGSPGGSSVLKQEVERWVKNEGRTLVKQIGEAPRPLGGTGAYLVELK